MGQKVHPFGFRLGFNKTWLSRWFADKDYAKLLHEDIKLRAELKKQFQHAGVAKIEIERAANKLKIDLHTSRPGIIIGRKGAEVDKLRQDLQKKTGREDELIADAAYHNATLAACFLVVTAVKEWPAIAAEEDNR